MRMILLFVFTIFVTSFSFAQFSAGAGFGTFRVLGSNNDFRGKGPTLMLKYVGDEETQEFFLDASFYKKSFNGSEAEINDDAGFFIGNATSRETYSMEHFQLGFKRSLGGDFTDSRFNCFLGAGGTLTLIKTNYKYQLEGHTVPDDNINHLSYGFHFSTGMQWRIKPVVLELRGNFDFDVKPIEIAGGDNYTYFLTSLRLGVVVPLTKF